MNLFRIVASMLVLSAAANLVAADAEQKDGGKRVHFSDAGYSFVMPDGWSIDNRSGKVGGKPSGLGVLISSTANSDFIKFAVSPVDMTAKELADSVVREMDDSIKKMPQKEADALSTKPGRKDGLDLGWARAEKFVIPTGPSALMLSCVIVVEKKVYQCSLFVTVEHAKEYEPVLDAVVKSFELETPDVRPKK
jgi:hypothetical protein